MDRGCLGGKSPGQRLIRRMFCLAVRVMIEKTMSVHDFQLDGKYYRQSGGGSIGLDLTGVVSDLYMLEWDKQLLRLMEADNMVTVVYKRYKDDVDFVFHWDVEIAIGEGESRDRVALDHVKTLADSIDSHLTVSTAVCSDFPDGRLPSLDVKVWIGPDKDGIMRILYTHYMKDVSSRSVMHYRSSHSDNMKVSVFINEVLRILRNCSPYTLWKEEAARHLSYFMRRMQYSGFSEETRFTVLSSALTKYDEKITSGNILNHRHIGKSQTEKLEWYRKGGKYDSVMFVEATPQSQLKKEVEKVLRRHKVKIKVVERVGTTVKRALQKSNPFQPKDCRRDGCLICAEGSGVDCRTRGVVYELWCKGCRRRYRGQTGRSTYCRCKEHVDESDEKAVVRRHKELFHDGEEVELGCRVLSQCFGKPSRRLIHEAVLIDELKDDETMNSKREWSFVKLNKVVV